MLKFSSSKEKSQLKLYTVNDIVAAHVPGTTFSAVNENSTPNLYLIVRGGTSPSLDFTKEIVCLSNGHGELFIRQGKEWIHNGGTMKLSEDRVFKVVDAKVEIEE